MIIGPLIPGDEILVQVSIGDRASHVTQGVIVAFEPKLSVILMVDRQRRRGQRALSSLLGQRSAEHLEIILLDFGFDDVGALPGSQDPRVRMITVRRGISYGAAKATGVRLARAPIVAFFEEHCVALPGWLDALLSVHEGPAAAAAGEVQNATPGQGITDVVALMCSGPWSAPARAGEALVLPGNNTSFRREILLSYADRLDVLLDEESVLHECLRRDGYSLVITPDAKCLHAFEDDVRSYLWVVFLHSRLTSATRARVARWTLRQRIGVVVRAMLGFAVSPARYTITSVRSDSVRRRLVWTRPHLILLSLWCVSLGRIVGVIAGSGDASTRNLDYDLNTRRLEPVV